MKRYIIVAVLVTLIYNFATASDTIPSGFSLPLRWRAGTDITAGWVAGTCAFLRGENPSDARINSTMSVDARVDFSFNTKTYQGILYKGLYQGIGINANTFFHGKTLGTPVSVYVYQGAPFATIGKHLRAGYEWQFGTAIGWKPYTEQYIDNQAPVSTHVTAHMPWHTHALKHMPHTHAMPHALSQIRSCRMTRNPVGSSGGAAEE
ncbi:MAG: hypothetical protein K2O47_04860 [Muribaculaceae bacterium]|nr:hypothetical protein [Muribaculaceae bacterium]